MSRLYDTMEPSVVDDEMLQKAVEEQGPKEEAGRIAKLEGIDFAEVESLRLDFKNILKIENLWCFKNLVKLQLDNNIIERMEGLDSLTSLKWLDLSFNNIEAIEGLENLVNLEDLTLYNNRITCIENMDNLKNLHVFSIGNNKLKELDNVLYLRRFKKLQTLNLNGNPISEEENYKLYIAAHLPSIEYLDYRLLDDAVRGAARQKYDISIQEIEHDEKQAEIKAEEEAVKAAEKHLHTSAYVENMNGSQLFEELYAEDMEGQKLATMPGVDELMMDYREKFTDICQKIYTYGLETHKERTVEVDMFWECLREAKQENKEAGVSHINDFMEYKKQVWLDMNKMDQTELEEKLSEYNDKVSQLWDYLMALEMQLVDQLEEVVRDFERNLADMVTNFIETVQGHFSQCRDLENNHHEKMLEISIVTLEKVVKNEVDDEMSDDLRELFVDKDTIINAVSSSHDVHLLKIDNKEDDIVTRINQWLSGTMEHIHDTEEISRNRARVTEINNLIDHLRDEIDNYDITGIN